MVRQIIPYTYIRQCKCSHLQMSLLLAILKRNRACSLKCRTEDKNFNAINVLCWPLNIMKKNLNEIYIRYSLFYTDKNINCQVI